MDRRAIRFAAHPAVAPYQMLALIFIPASWAFFDEGLHAFKRRSVHHIACHGLTRSIVCGCDTELGLPIEQFLSHCDCDAWFGNNCRHELFKFGVELFGFCDTVDQATCS